MVQTVGCLKLKSQSVYDNIIVASIKLQISNIKDGVKSCLGT